jgi:hypothetical protein
MALIELIRAGNHEMISTRRLSELPDVAALRQVCQATAMLDAILSPDWEYRYYSFNSRWDDNVQVASMRDGSGDWFHCAFGPQGVLIIGCGHESPMASSFLRTGRPHPGVIDAVPMELTAFLSEPAFTANEATFCLWNVHNGAWGMGMVEFPAGNDPDGSEKLLNILDGKPETYKRWADEYYGVSLPLHAVAHVYAHRPLSPRVIEQLNESVAFETVADDLAEIGYTV